MLIVDSLILIGDLPIGNHHSINNHQSIQQSPINQQSPISNQQISPPRAIITIYGCQ
jgi:hypothetical protein